MLPSSSAINLSAQKKKKMGKENKGADTRPIGRGRNPASTCPHNPFRIEERRSREGTRESVKGGALYSSPIAEIKRGEGICFKIEERKKGGFADSRY